MSSSTIWLPDARRADRGDPLLGEEEAAQFNEPRPINGLFANALIAVIHAADPLRRKRLMIDMGMTAERGAARRDIGVFSAKVGSPARFEVTVNWTPETQQHIPPGHILVKYRDREIGMLSPFTDGLPIDGHGQVNYWRGDLLPEPVRRLDLMDACAETIAKRTHRDELWRGFGGDRVDEQKGIKT